MEILFIILAICVLIAITYLRTSTGRGWLGELRVKLIIGKTVQGEKYVINDFTFLCDGKSAQIDHIVINKNAVYIIETKNYSGRIYGSNEQRYWTQVLAFGKVKNRIYSPVKQNAGHIYKLGRALGENVFLDSVVVFVQNNTQFIRSDTVIPLKALKYRLAISSKIKPYTASQMQDIYQALLGVRNTDITLSEHIERIREDKELVEHNLCPFCKKPLVTRQGKFGQFLGCSGYPECKYIKR